MLVTFFYYLHSKSSEYVCKYFMITFNAKLKVKFLLVKHSNTLAIAIELNLPMKRKINGALGTLSMYNFNKIKMLLPTRQWWCIYFIKKKNFDSMLLIGHSGYFGVFRT